MKINKFSIAGRSYPQLLKYLAVMKFIVLLICASFFQVCANSYAQTVTLSKKNVSIIDVFREIKKQTDFNLICNSQIIRDASPVSINVRNVSLADALEELLTPNGLDYIIENKAIVVKKASFIKGGIVEKDEFEKEKVQQVEVSGRVTDEYGEALVGVSVLVKGKSTGATTNLNGEYSILVQKEDVLVYSYIGFDPYEQVYSGQTRMDAILVTNIQDIDEVVVVGYGTQRRSTVTGAINQVGRDVFESKPITNVSQALQGVIPNLNITFGDGTPGRSGDYNIRGFTSINGGGPLILIDGVPGELDLLNPDDIETLTVLKDASSAAIYGARASFGVILVTTKSGKKGDAKVNYSNQFGFNQTLGLPKVVDALTNATIQNEAYKGYAGSDNASLLLVIDYLKKRASDPSLPELGTDAAGNFIRGSDTDWYDSFYNQNQFFNKHSLNISGGSDKVKYYLSGGYNGQDGVFKLSTDNFKRYNFRAKIDAELKPWLSLFNNAEFSEGTYDSPNKFVNTAGNNVYRYLSLFSNSYEAIKTANGNWTQAGALTFGQLQDGGRSNSKNRMIRNTTGFRINLFADQIKLNGDFTLALNQHDDIIQSLQVKYETKPGAVVTYPNPDFYSKTSREIFHSVANLYASFEKSIKKHNVNVLLGASNELDRDRRFFARRDGNITSALSSLNLTSGDASVGDNNQTWALMSFFYRMNYNYEDKYLLEFNGRYDGTSRFPEIDRFGFFPSVSAGWVVSEESFFTPLKSFINTLKLRSSYGGLGNQQVGAYPYISSMNISQAGFILDGQRPLYTRSPGLVSPALTWETATTFDLGVDLSMLSNRLQLGFDWYQRNTTNMLTKSKSLPAVLGSLEPKSNAADLSTKGLEFSARWLNQFQIKDKLLKYNIALLFSDNQSEITKYDNPAGLLSDFYEGQNIGEIWGYTNDGFFKSDDEYLSSPNQSKISTIEYQSSGHPLAGDIKFKDLDGNNRIDNGESTLSNPGDLSIIGNTNPRYAYGINLGFDFSGFDMNVFFQGVGKRDFWPGAESGVFWGTYNRWNQPIYEHIHNNYWTPENTDAYFPRLRSYQALGENRSLGTAQTKYLQDASYLRLKNLTLGYTLPKTVTSSIGISKVRVFASGYNLITWTKLSKAFDPESIGDEMDNVTKSGNGFVYPMQRTFVGGIDISF